MRFAAERDAAKAVAERRVQRLDALAAKHNTSREERELVGVKLEAARSECKARSELYDEAQKLHLGQIEMLNKVLQRNMRLVESNNYLAAESLNTDAQVPSPYS